MSETASVRSGTNTMSETSSQKSDARMLRRNKREAEEGEEGDLLEQKRSFQEGVFTCMYALVRQSALSSWKFAVIKMLLEGLCPFIVIFNPSLEWMINTSNPVWQVIRWTVWRSPIMRLYGYDVYIRVLYVMAIAVLLAVAGLIWLTMVMRKQEQAKWMRTVSMALHVVYEVIFMIFYVAFLDYFVFAANCHWTESVKTHVYYTDVDCLAMPHMLHMSVALVAALVHFSVTALVMVASCDLNPLSRAYLASPDAVSRLKILVAKAAFIICANDLQGWPKPQGVMVVLAAGWIFWWNFRKMPFYRFSINVVWCGMWFAVLYVTFLLASLAFDNDNSEERRRSYTDYVLYGAFPCFAGGVTASWLHGRWVMAPSRKFQNGGSFKTAAQSRRAYKFSDQHEVELLSRVMRRFNIDGRVLEDAAAHGDAVIKAGMQGFPSSPFLYVLYANFLLEVRRDAPAARTQLQLALKHSPTLVERYQIYCTMEASKRLKDGQDGGMDLQAYIEFRRNFKAVLRVHKEVLLLEVELWRMCLRSSLQVAAIDAMLDDLEAATARAHQVYKRVIERYPTNGKLLRCYGKFLEDVRHDAGAAARAYAEAVRNGGADAIMSLDLSAVQQASHIPEFLTSMSLVDDAVVVINAEGTIMMVSQAMQSVFGYTKAELEGANVSLLMPQPFSQRHDSYLARYVTSGEPHILDSVREVVALHKERYVFPVMLCVTKMSGTGQDSVFLGVLRPLVANTLRVRAWLAPNGTFLCGDQQFASLCGITEKDLVGHSLQSLVASPESEVETLLEKFHSTPFDQLAAGLLRFELLLRHRFLGPVPVEATVLPAGADEQRIMALSVRRADGQDGSILVVDPHMRIRFASLGLANLLNYPMRKMVGMRLDQLLPPPYNAFHVKYLRDPPLVVPPASCRSGRVVQLLNDSGVPVPVRLVIHSTSGDDGGMSLWVVQVEKVPVDAVFEEKRLVLTADVAGRVHSVSQPLSSLFGFTAGDMVGHNLCDCVDIFSEWRDRNGVSQLQLLMLALIDREQEMPGTSWRVRIQAPHSGGNGNALPALTPGAPSTRHHTGAISACLQIELVDNEGSESNSDYDAEADLLARVGGPSHFTAGATGGVNAAGGAFGGGATDIRIKVTLWRRDLLTGVVELDEHLVVRRASPLTGLIVGLPSAGMLRKPLHRFLDIPRHQSWDAITASHTHSKKRSALKRTTDRGLVSPLMAFIGPHPDMGTMRIHVQGLQTLAPGGKSKIVAVLHPDTTFQGAHADLLRALHLDGVGGEGAADAAPRATTAAAGGGERAQQEGQQGLRVGGNGERSSGKAGGKAAGGGRPSSPAQRRLARAGSGVDDDGDDGVDDSGSGDREGDEEEQDADMGTDLDQDEDAGNEAGSGSVNQDPLGRGGVTRGSARADDEEDSVVKGHAQLHRRASSKSDFVAQWVRTVSKRMMGADAGAQPAATAAGEQGDAPRPSSEQGPARRSVSRGDSGRAGSADAEADDAAAPLLALPAPPVSPMGKDGGTPPSGRSRRMLGAKGSRLPTIPESSRARSDMGDDDKDGDDRDRAARRTSVGGSEDGAGGGAGPRKGADGGGADDENWEKQSDAESSIDDSQSVSGVTGVTDGQSAADIMVDARRGRLLKSLRKVLMGPMLMAPLERLRLHSYCLLGLMLVAHVACYVVVTRIIAAQHTGVYKVYRQAMAMDRAQLLVVRILIGTYCERANVTAKVSACTPPLSLHITNMQASLVTLEEDHQGVYLGFDSSSVSPPEKKVYDVWTQPLLDYHVYMDTSPPQVLTLYTGVWQLGNRFIAASREALYWMPALRDRFKSHRVYQFMVTNGLGSLFTGYATSLDLLVNAAWSALDTLKTHLAVLLVVEVMVVQALCLSYEWMLIRQVERARLLGVVCMVGLPAPVLRQLVSREVKVLDESDDDDDDDDGDNGDNANGNEGGKPPNKSQEEGDADTAAAAGGDGDGGGGGVDADPLAFGGSSAAGGDGGGGGSGRVLRGSESGVGKARVRHADSVSYAQGSVRGAQRESSADGGDSYRPAGLGKGAGGAMVELAAGDGGGKAEGYGSRKGSQLPARQISPTGYTPSVSEAGQEDAPFLAGPGGASKYDTMPAGRTASDTKQRPPGRWRRPRGFGSQLVNGKALVTSRWREIKFMLMLFLWAGAVLAIYLVSIVKLNGMQGPLASLNMASHVIYRYTRVRAVGFAFLAQDDATSRSIWRDLLSSEVRLFKSEYEALMYGGTAISQASSVFTHPVPPSTFASASFANEFFRTKRCFRYNQTLCAKPGTPYYEVTHNGLDVMVRRMITEMELMIDDDDPDAVYNGTRWTYMYNVGTFDLYEGLQQAAQLFVDYSISRYNQVTTLHTVLLAATFVVIAAYILFVLWPHLAKFTADAARQSALLSHVPADVDTIGHVKATCRKARAAAAKRRAKQNKVAPVPATTGALMAV